MAVSRIGIVLAIVASVPAIAGAQSGAAPRVSVTRSGGQVTIAARADTFSVSHTLASTTFDLQVSEGADKVRFVGDKSGQLRIQRGGHTMSMAMLEATGPEMQQVKSLLAGSRALARFDRIMGSDWTRATREAAAFEAPHAIVAYLQGNTAPLDAVMLRVRTASQPRISTMAQTTASWCWRSYERDVLAYTYELEDCVDEASNSINPMRIAWCAYSYNLKASLAFIWLLDCSGY
jgi:hypothetical protein